MSVASVLTATTVLVIGYRLGRTHAAWRDVRSAKKSVSASRRAAWRHTATLFLGTVALVLTLAVAGYELSTP
ncbi:hypothetical protein AB0M20_30315 [Actinoplanes sp. NPDC051633]|uniref:hypothetical protein n=1 Tax=Actinoplanes sp. NPDC051633 TaxID=3155670 RepID=UPI0034211B0A